MRVTPPAQAPAPAPRLWALDAFRGLCALVVFLSHWHLWSDFAANGGMQRFVRYFGDNLYEAFSVLTWPTGGHHPAVICFFVLSGFCIHYPFAVRVRQGVQPAWRDYYRRRFKRIFPVYWIAALLGLAYVALETAHPSGRALLGFHATLPPYGAVVRLTGLEGLYPDEIIAGNYILTTIGTEVLMYAAYPLLYGFALKHGWGRLGILCVALHLFSIVLLQFITPFWVFNSVFMLGLFWYAGALAAHLYEQGRLPPVRIGWLLAAWGLFLGLKAIPHFYGRNFLKQAAWGLVCTLAIVLVLKLQDRHPAWRERAGARFFRWLGDISYSLYAVHTPVIMFTSWTLFMLVHNQDYFLQLAATLTASFAVTLAVHYGVERRFYARPAAPRT